MVIAAGKSRKNVDAYVLLPPDAQRAVNLLIGTRAEVGVPSSNPYIFARMSTNTPLSGNSELQEVVNACKNILHPNRITSTSLRKYIATVSQVGPCVRFNCLKAADCFNKLYEVLNAYYCIVLLW